MFSKLSLIAVVGILIASPIAFAQTLPDKTPLDRCKNFRISIEKKGLEVAQRGGYEYVGDFLTRCMAAGVGSVKCNNLVQKALLKEGGILCDGEAHNCGFVEYLPYGKEELRDEREWTLLCADRCDPSCNKKVEDTKNLREGIRKQQERFKLEPPAPLKENLTPEGIPYEEYKKYPDPRVLKVFTDEADPQQAPARTGLVNRVSNLLDELIRPSVQNAQSQATYQGSYAEWNPFRMSPPQGQYSNGLASPRSNTDRFVPESTFTPSGFFTPTLWSQIRFVDQI